MRSTRWAKAALLRRRPSTVSSMASGGTPRRSSCSPICKGRRRGSPPASWDSRPSLRGRFSTSTILQSCRSTAVAAWGGTCCARWRRRRSSSAAARLPWRCRRITCGRGGSTSAPGLRRRCTARRRAGRSSTPRSSRNMRPVEIRPLSLLFLAMLAAAQPAERPNGVLLVAKPGLTDPNFRETVVLVTQTPDAQTVGVILNRPTERKLSGETVFFGGPVLRETIVALFQSREQPEPPAFHVLRGVYLTMRPETIERLLARPGQRFRLYAGFSGWAPLQLQAELERDDWYVLPASVDLLFRKDTAGLWSELLAEPRGERAAEERKSPAGAGLEPGCRASAARAALFHGGLRHSVETRAVS